MEKMKIKILEIDKLHIHERTDSRNLDRIYAEVCSLQKVVPILVDEKTMVVLDGHHRLKTLKMLGVNAIPAVLVDYFDEKITVEPRRKNIPVSKELVLDAGMSGKPFPPKTSRHVTNTPILAGFPLSRLYGDGFSNIE